VTTAVFKLLGELSDNAKRRIDFNQTNSAGGVRLFRLCAAAARAYVDRIVSFQPPADRVYKAKLKGMSLCLGMLCNTLSADYLNFGLFTLYKDPALSEALQTSLKLASNLSINVVLEYPKAAKVYFRYLRCLFVHHLETVATVDNATFAALVNALQQGLAAD